MRLIRTLSEAQELLQEPVWSKRWADWVLREVTEFVEVFGVETDKIPDETAVFVLEPGDIPRDLGVIAGSHVEWSQVHIFGGRQTWKIVFNDDGRLTILYGMSGIDPQLDRLAERYAWNTNKRENPDE